MPMVSQLSLSLLVCLLALARSKAPKLGSYNVDRDQISVSGVSSGAFFSVQFHVAFSSTIMGAGVVAGGPFWCAQDQLEVALSACMKSPELISVNELVTITYTTALSKTIDKPSHLANDRVYLFSGSLDSVVNPGVVKKLAQYYSSFIKEGEVYEVFNVPSEHAMVTGNYGNECGMLSTPYINNCNFSLAFDILKHIYKIALSPPHTEAVPDNLLEFDQSVFLADLPEVVSMDTTGFVYVPTACQNKTTVCRLHIALHGCLQGRVYVGDVFARHAGYNTVAEANDIIVLYPQAVNSTLNPKGCWDWWGYSSTAYSSKLGPQMAAVKLMLDKIAF